MPDFKIKFKDQYYGDFSEIVIAGNNKREVLDKIFESRPKLKSSLITSFEIL